MKFILTLALATLSLNTFADQCAYVTPETATTAAKLISLSQKNSGVVLNLCQNCGETKPEVKKVNQISVGQTGVDSSPYEITLNGQGIDLAYTYVNIGNDMFVNLGKLSNCPNEGTSQFITKKVDANGKVRYIPGPKL